MDSLKRPTKKLIELCHRYAEFVKQGVSDERSVAHQAVMNQMKEDGYTFVDRDDARELCFRLIELDALFDFVAEHTVESKDELKALANPT